MIIEEIKKANIEAMKSKNSNLRTIYSVVINKYMQLEINNRTTGQTTTDADMVKLIVKTIKELEEESANYQKVNNMEEVKNIEEQKAALTKYLPEMLSKDKIKEIILTLEDKTVPSVMRHFKTNYNGQCDMKDVSDVLKSL
jgi:uncharacterized protein YqeY